jgi:hypothetical protein
LFAQKKEESASEQDSIEHFLAKVEAGKTSPVVKHRMYLCNGECVLQQVFAYYWLVLWQVSGMNGQTIPADSNHKVMATGSNRKYH